LRLQYFSQITGGDADLKDPIVIKRQQATDEAVADFYTKMNRASKREYLWNDAACQDGHISPFRPLSVTTPLSRLSSLAVVYATKGSVYYHDPQVKKDVLEGLEWMYSHKWSPKYPAYGNWWDWVVGMPLSVENILVAMYDDFTPEDRAKYIQTLDYYTPDVNYEGASTGANKVWQCFSMALRGVLAHDESKIRMGVEGLKTELKTVNRHDGFYEDGSFVQHQWHPYTGGYGASFLNEMARMMILFGKYGEPVSILSKWIETAYFPLIFNGAMMDMVRGREIARETVSDHATGHSILLSAYNILKSADEETRNRLLPRIKYELTNDTARDFLSQSCPTWQLAEMREFLHGDRTKAQPPAPYHKQFSAMDRIVHRGNGFALGLAMSSNRIENYETLDRENMKSWHTGDGVTYLYTADQKLFSDQFWSTVDYYRLPGITVDAEQQHEAKSLVFGKGLLYPDGYKSPSKWVGGASLDGKYGIAGMWFRDEKSSLHACKSWFMVDNEILVLGTGVSSSDDRTIETIIDNRKINGMATITLDGSPILESNGETNVKTALWAHFDAGLGDTKADVGYYFPETADIHLKRETRSGSWSEFNFYGSPIVHTRNYFNLWISHGKNPSAATYAYILLPCKSAAETKTYAASPNMKILINTPNIQVVKAERERITAWNFWEASVEAVYGLSVDAPCSVIIKELDNELLLGVSDPTQENDTLTITLYHPVTEAVTENTTAEVHLSDASITLKINVKGAIGATKVIKLRKR